MSTSVLQCGGIQTHMAKIDLKGLPDLKGRTLITTLAEFNEFTPRLRQDQYSPKKLAKFKDLKELRKWLAVKKPGMQFFAIIDDEEDNRQNDDWGHYDVSLAVAIVLPDKTVTVMEKALIRFDH